MILEPAWPPGLGRFKCTRTSSRPVACRPTIVKKIANPINTSLDTTILMHGYTNTVQSRSTQTPHSSASNIAGTIAVAIVQMPIYTTTFVRTGTRVSTQHTNWHVAKVGTDHRHHDVSPNRPPLRLSHSPQTRHFSRARIQMVTRAA